MAKILYKIDFDNLENKSPISKMAFGVFVDSEEKNAYSKIQEWFDTNGAGYPLYTGWDEQVYPQWEIKEVLDY